MDIDESERKVPTLLHKKSKYFHEMFTTDGSPMLPIYIKTLTHTLKAMAEKKPNQDWTFAYNVQVAATKQFMNALADSSVPPINGFQKATANPSKIPIGATHQLAEYTADPRVINFLKENGPGEWPAHAEDISVVNGEWIYADKDSEKILYFIHGGAFVGGCAEFYRPITFRLCQQTGCKAFAINYRLAPQSPYPCGLIDTVSGYLYLLENYKPENIILAGDSAGGNLVFAALLVIRDMGLPIPGGAYCMSPWVIYVSYRSTLPILFPVFMVTLRLIISLIPTNYEMKGSEKENTITQLMIASKLCMSVRIGLMI
jgi:acetyl esterase/lipase